MPLPVMQSTEHHLATTKLLCKQSNDANPLPDHLDSMHLSRIDQQLVQTDDRTKKQANKVHFESHRFPGHSAYFQPRPQGWRSQSSKYVLPNCTRIFDAAFSKQTQSSQPCPFSNSRRKRDPLGFSFCHADPMQALLTG
jgi:hypothetical protein